MALTKPTVGSKYVLSNDGPFGEGHGAVPDGTLVTVDVVVKTPEPGVTGDLVLSWEEEGATRRASFTLSDFRRLFKPAGAKK